MRQLFFSNQSFSPAGGQTPLTYSKPIPYLFPAPCEMIPFLFNSYSIYFSVELPKVGSRGFFLSFIKTTLDTESFRISLRHKGLQLYLEKLV